MILRGKGGGPPRSCVGLEVNFLLFLSGFILWKGLCGEAVLGSSLINNSPVRTI